MRDFPSCFGENGVQVADSSSSSSSNNNNHHSNAAGRNGQNVVSCIYRAHLSGGGAHHRCLISVTWSRNLMGQGFSISIDDDNTSNCNTHNNNSSSSSSSSLCCCKVEIKPWLFSKRKGSKTLDLGDGKLDIIWDLSSARFGPGPEPLGSFFVAIAFDLEMVLLLGDLVKEAYRKANANANANSNGNGNPPPVLVAKREHIFGKRAYSTRAQLCDNGQFHDIVIECETAAQVGLKDPSLEIRIDRKRVMQVKRLAWKFRGNQTILVDGLAVEVFWDVHNWLFGAPVGSAVFMFQTCPSDKLLGTPLLPCSDAAAAATAQEPAGFSLVLHAWKNE